MSNGGDGMTHGGDPRRIRVLVVDDSAVHRINIIRALEDFNVDIDEASDGLEGVALGQRAGEQFHLVITDIDMPVMDGFFVLTIMQNAVKHGLSHKPFIVAATAREDLSVVVSRGFDSVIKKPFTKKHVQSILRPFIDKCDQRSIAIPRSSSESSFSRLPPLFPNLVVR